MPITRKRYTTADVKKIRNLLRRGNSLSVIAKRTGRTIRALENFINRMGWTKDRLKMKRRPYSEQEENLIWKWRGDGHKNNEIATALGRTHNAVCKYVSINGV